MSRHGILLVFAVLAAAALAPATPAAAGSGGDGFGVTPVELAFTEPPLVRDGESEGTFRVQNRGDAPARVDVTPEGALAEWLTFDPGTAFTVPAGASVPLVVRVHVPEDVANGDYEGYVRLKATGTGTPDGSGASMNVELVPLVRVRVTGDEVQRFGAENLRVEGAIAHAPLTVLVDAFNRGNVRAAPVGTLAVRDAAGAVLLEETVTGVVFQPGKRVTQSLSTEGALDVGAYEATLTLRDPVPGQEPLVALFEVLPASAANAGPVKGALDAVHADDATRPGAVVGVTATFTNTGAAPITSAKMTAEILRAGERVGVVVSDPLRVGPGETVELVAYYQPTEPGAFSTRAFVVYDGVRSGTLDAPFVVHASGSEGSGKAGGFVIPAAPALVVLALGAFVAFTGRWK